MIRKIRESDKEKFIEMSKDFYSSDVVFRNIPEKFHFDAFEELMRSDEYAECYIFEVEGEIAGYALLAKTYSREAGGNTVWIEELYVLPQYRGKGIGTKFFDCLFEKIPAARYRLEVEPENERAVKLYKEKGFYYLPYQQMIKGN